MVFLKIKASHLYEKFTAGTRKKKYPFFLRTMPRTKEYKNRSKNISLVKFIRVSVDQRMYILV